jgi:hypothetical protein
MAVELRLLGVPAKHTSELSDLVKKNQWRVQPLIPSQFQSSVFLSDETDSSLLASRLFKLGGIHFEIEHLVENQLGIRILCVPSLGMKRQLIDEIGRVLIPENELDNFAEKLSENPSAHKALYRQMMGFAHQDRLDELKINTDSVSVIPKVG